jgi:hypothetical protein
MQDVGLPNGRSLVTCDKLEAAGVNRRLPGRAASYWDETQATAGLREGYRGEPQAMAGQTKGRQGDPG